MPAFTRDLERTLRRALSIAGGKGHAQAGLAHLALALTDDPSVSEVLRACDVDVAALKVSLHRVADAAHRVGLQPRATVVSTPAFDLVIERAARSVQACGRDRVATPNVLVALLAEPGDDAAEVLRQGGATNVEATRFVSQGLRKARNSDDTSRAAAGYPGEAVRVLLLDNDVTPLEFVAEIVRDVFDKDEGEARRLMLNSHKRGFAECGAYLPEEAAAKVAAVAKLARDHQHPLDCVMEPMRGLSDALLFTKPRTVLASGAGHRQRA